MTVYLHYSIHQLWVLPPLRATFLYLLINYSPTEVVFEDNRIPCVGSDEQNVDHVAYNRY
jgi:hypothetical protein